MGIRSKGSKRHQPDTPEQKRRKAEYDKQRYEQSKKNRLAFRTPPNKAAQSVLNGACKRARKALVPFCLTIEDIVVPARCPVLGIPLKNWGENTAPRFDSPSIDRINPKKGYVRSNIRVISWRANKLKGDATIKEVEAILAYMKSATKEGSIKS